MQRRSSPSIAPSAAESGTELRPPSALLLALEGRAPWEYAALLASRPWLRRLPRGDGHPVLILPGLGANDFTTGPLRRFLGRLGHTTHPWGQGFNLGPREGVLDRCADDLSRLFESQSRQVSLIGWSLGGIYAREVAKLLPDQVRCVITLGTPFTGHPRATNAWRVFELLSGQTMNDNASLLERVRKEPPVPTTSIWSRSDGIVSWRCSVVEPGPQAENISVQASHLGLGFNPLALCAIADRLAQPAGAWKPFEPPAALRWLFDSPDNALAA